MKIRITIILICIALGIAGFIWYKSWRKDFIQKKLPNLVFLKSDSLYRITYDSVYVDEVGGEIIIKNLQLNPDTTYKKSSDPSFPKNILRVTVPQLHITGVQTDAAIIDKQIIARTLLLSRPVVTMYVNKDIPKTEKTDSTATSYAIYKVLLRGLEKIAVDTIKIDTADYHICDWEKGDTTFTSKSITASLYEINISDSTSTDTSRMLFAKRSELTVDKIRIRDKKGLYSYILNDMQMHSEDSSFAVETVFVQPLLGEAAFVKAAKWQTDRIDIDFKTVKFSGMNLSRLLDGNLIADELTVGNAQFRIFRDKSYPEKGDSKVGQYPQQLFAKIPLVVGFKKMVVQSGSLMYKEKNPKTASSGHVQFADMSATLYNVTNRPKELQTNSVCTVHFKCLLLDKVPLSATLQLYTGDPKGRFTAKGKIGATEASFYNILTRPMAIMEIKSGDIKSLDFNLQCSNYKSTGTVVLLYNDLKIRVLKPGEENKKELKRKKLASIVANVIIKNDNPKKGDSPRVANVDYQRDVTKSMFNLMWKAIFTGLMKSVGIEGKLPI